MDSLKPRPHEDETNDRPDGPAVPFWPLTTELEADFDRQHPDYLESP